MYPEQRGHVRSVILFGNRIDGRSTRCDQTETMHGHETPHRSFTIEYLKNKCSRRIFFDLYFINTCELDFTRFLQERKHKMIMPTKHYSHLTRVHDALLFVINSCCDKHFDDGNLWDKKLLGRRRAWRRTQ